MKKTLLIAALLATLTTVGCTSVRKVGEVNGLDVTRITTRSVFAPSSTSVLLSDPSKPGTIEATVANASGQGLVPAIANAAGVVGGAALLRPDRSSTAVSNGSSSTATGGTGGKGGKGGEGGNATGGNATGGSSSSSSSATGGFSNASIHDNFIGPVQPPGCHTPHHRGGHREE